MRNKGKMLRICTYFLIILVLGTTSILAACAESAVEEEEEEGPPVGENWWDKFGKPQYGDTLTVRVNTLADNFDPLNLPWTANYFSYEVLFQPDWTLDRDIFGFKIPATPDPDWLVGTVVDSWEWQDEQTMILHLKQGVHFHDKAPTYGREFVAEDVAYHYDQVFGTGHGFTEPNPFVAGWCSAIDRVTAQDKYTAIVKFKEPTPIANFWAISDQATDASMVPHELYESDPKDWRNATGTGAFMVSDFVAGSYLTYIKNPDYYGYDPRHPENKLPYVDKVEMLCIPDVSTAVAAIRTGQIDVLNDLDWQNGLNLKKSNPELIFDTRPDNGPGVQPRADQEPFTDIRVRKALQLAINIPEIAEKFYGGNVPAEPVGLISTDLKGWCTPYADWPQSLKDEYKYDPAQARNLLEEAGYPNGFKTTLHMSSTGSTEFAQIMKSYLKDIGVDVDINMMDNTAWGAFVISKQYTGMTLSSWLAMTWPVGISLFNVTSMNVNNAIRHQDATYDGYYEQFMSSKTTEEAQRILLTADQYAMKQHWQITTTAGVLYNIWQPYVGGYSGEIMSPMGWLRHMVWMHLWIDQAEKKEMGR